MESSASLEELICFLLKDNDKNELFFVDVVLPIRDVKEICVVELGYEAEYIQLN